MKLNWKNLTKDERAEYMQLQMSPSSSSYSAGGMLPDDCSDCAACGQPIHGSGWCEWCHSRFDKLKNKLVKI